MQTIKQRVLAKANQLKKADTSNSSESLYQAIFEILDLEDRIKSIEAQPQTAPSYPVNRDFGSITIEEWSDDEGRLRSIPPEADWITSISRQTNLDIRAILSPLPKELGLFELKIVYVKQNIDGWENEAKEWVPSNGFNSTVHFATVFFFFLRHWAGIQARLFEDWLEGFPAIIGVIRADGETSHEGSSEAAFADDSVAVAFGPVDTQLLAVVLNDRCAARLVAVVQILDQSHCLSPFFRCWGRDCRAPFSLLWQSRGGREMGHFGQATTSQQFASILGSSACLLRRSGHTLLRRWHFLLLLLSLSRPARRLDNTLLRCRTLVIHMGAEPVGYVHQVLMIDQAADE